MSDDYGISVPIELPLDSDGFIRRRCPSCDLEFKWHSGPANEEAEHHDAPAAYSCPLCGTPAANDSWSTDAQIELAQALALPQVIGLIQDEIESAFKKTKGVTYKRGRAGDADTPDPLVEPDDMVIVASPCHGYEPVKVPENATGPFYCLVCGAAFAT